MQLDYELLPGGETLRQRLERDRRAINTLLADARTDELVVECYGAGYALLRPEHSQPAEPFIPRAELREWVFETRSRCLIAAPTLERAQRWFVDESDIGVDNEHLEFCEVQFIGQTVRSMDQEPEPRYVLTDQGRRDLAVAQLFDKGPTVAEVIAARPALCPACQQSQDTPSCSRREHWGVA